MLIGHLINNLFSSFQLSGEQQREGAATAAHLNVRPAAGGEHGAATSLLPVGRSPRGWKTSEGWTSGAELQRMRGNNRTEITGEARPALLLGAFEWNLQTSDEGVGSSGTRGPPP